MIHDHIVHDKKKYDMDQEIIKTESNEEVENMQCLKVEELFWQPKSHNIKCLRNYVFMRFHLL